MIEYTDRHFHAHSALVSGHKRPSNARLISNKSHTLNQTMEKKNSIRARTHTMTKMFNFMSLCKGKKINTSQAMFDTETSHGVTVNCAVQIRYTIYIYTAHTGDRITVAMRV